MNRNRKVVVVTGASAGVGRAVVREFAARGAAIGLLARDPARLEATRAEVERLGGWGLAIPTDVANPDAVEAAADRIERELGPIDVWINNAMATVFSRCIEITSAEFQRATDVTYLGTVYGTLAALRRMHPRNRGTIVQVGSALAYRGIPLQAPYCAAKHAVRGFTDSLRCELLHERKNIHLSMVQLSAINTPQFEWCRTRLPRHPQPVPPIFAPEVAARGIAWAADHHPRELNVGWPATRAIVGNKLVPGFADWYLARNGYDAQQTPEPVDADRPSNLFDPVPGEYAAQGRFADRAAHRSWQLWMATHRSAIAFAVAGLLGATAAWLVEVRLGAPSEGRSVSPGRISSARRFTRWGVDCSAGLPGRSVE
jgi:NAD(P)-dependent dehydrogenase (short-subunit alcohol dehydrogenase family)